MRKISIMKRNNISKRGRLRMPIAVTLLLILTGCATSGSVRQTDQVAGSDIAKITRPGDVADIHFQCSLPNGELAVATDSNTVKEDQPKSKIYLKRDKSDPVSVVILDPAEKSPGEKERSFEDDIVALLAGQLTGLKEGETRHINLTAQDIPERKKDDYVISLARVRERPKEIKMTIDEYKSRTGMSPEAGKPFILDPFLDGKVESFTDKEVIVRFSTKEVSEIQTPFGAGRIREDADSFRIEIDAHKGSPVRSGHLVGRITEVDDKVMTVDYRNPFGSETLSCDVTVNKITEAETKKDGTVEK